MSLFSAGEPETWVGVDVGEAWIIWRMTLALSGRMRLLQATRLTDGRGVLSGFAPGRPLSGNSGHLDSVGLCLGWGWISDVKFGHLAFMIILLLRSKTIYCPHLAI